MPLPRPLLFPGLCALAVSAGAARAADLDRPYPPEPPPYEAPLRYDAPAGRGPVERGPVDAYGPERGLPPAPRFAAAGACRTFVRRRLGPDGEPVPRQVQICDEPDGGPGFERGPPPPPPPPEEVPPRRWGGPRW